MANYIGRLNEYVNETHSTIRYDDVGCVGPDHIRTFSVRVVLNGHAYPEGVGKTKKEAKHKAAENAWTLMQEVKNAAPAASTPAPSPINQAQGLPELNVSEIIDMTRSLSLTTADAEKNYIGLINEHCQKEGLSYSFVLEDKQGPSHVPQYSYKLLINHQEYSVGKGNSAKDAKQNAAQLAWSLLRSPPRSDVSGDVPAEVSTPKSAIVCETGSKAASALLHEGVRFAGSPASLKDQSSEVKCRRRLAANFPDAHRNGKEVKEMMPDSGMISASRETTSRFKSEFESIVRLGYGGFGRVFKARRKQSKKEVAVKIVLHDKKALREVHALSELNHCNIVRYYSCWSEDYTCEAPSAQESPLKYLYIEMELCSTETLRSWINKNNRNQSQEKRKEKSLSIFRQIVSGVEYFHYKDLVHRDLKPENIMFGQDKEVKIGDFGLVTVAACEERTEGRGTASYMAPEQKDTKKYGREVDIFPLGLIYFELIWKLSAEERKEVWDDVRKQETPAEFSQNHPFEDLMIKKMLSVNPDQRPEAKAVRRELELNKPCERTNV